MNKIDEILAELYCTHDPAYKYCLCVNRKQDLKTLLVQMVEEAKPENIFNPEESFLAESGFIVAVGEYKSNLLQAIERMFGGER